MRCWRMGRFREKLCENSPILIAYIEADAMYGVPTFLILEG